MKGRDSRHGLELDGNSWRTQEVDDVSKMRFLFPHIRQENKDITKHKNKAIEIKLFPRQINGHHSLNTNMHNK